MSLSLQKDNQNMVLNGKLRLNICLCVVSIEDTYSSFIELFLNWVCEAKVVADSLEQYDWKNFESNSFRCHKGWKDLKQLTLS